VILVFLWYDVWKALWPEGHFGITVGTLVLALNSSLLTMYTFSCHSLRHLVAVRSIASRRTPSVACVIERGRGCLRGMSITCCGRGRVSSASCSPTSTSGWWQRQNREPASHLKSKWRSRPALHFASYEILGPLGAGGMGEVYRAHDPRIGRDVAIKVLRAATATDPDRLQRFQQEAHAAGILNHPNLLTIYELGTSDGAPYIVSELLEGETLRER